MRFRPKPLTETADASQGDPENWRERFQGWISAALTISALGFTLWFLSHLVVAWVPPCVEAGLFKWGDIFGEDVLSDADHQRAHKIFKELLAEAELRALPFALTIIEDDTPNAFTVPGGRVFITSSLFELSGSEMGLAFVLAHELGHQHHRHTLQPLSWSVLSQMTLNLVGMAGSNPLQASSILASLHFSRTQESEADDFALALVERVYGTTEGALVFFEKLLAEGKGHNARWSDFLATHPAVGERLKHLQGR